MALHDSKLITGCIVLLPIVLLFFIVWADVDVDGERVVSYIPGKTSPFIERFLPDERVTLDGQTLHITDEPAYASVHVPNQEYTGMDVELTFSTEDQPILEIGPLIDIFSQSALLLPLKNTIIDTLHWSKKSAVYADVYARNNDIASVDAFFDNPPDVSRIAIYNYDWQQPTRLPDYEASNRILTMQHSLRGHHTYKTYIKDETFSLSIFAMDMNRTAGRDDMVIRVWNEQDQLMLEERIDDDGNETENQISTDHRFSLQSNGDWPEGVYTVELSGTSDIFWRELQTPQQYMVFVNKVYLGDTVGYLTEPQAAQLYTNAKHMTLQTLHADATQDIQFGNTLVSLPYSHELVYASLDEFGVIPVLTERDDVTIIGDGKFSFSEGAFFDPDPLKITALTDLDDRNIDYVVTGYTSPERDASGRYIAKQSFTLDPSMYHEGDIRLLLSAPYIAHLDASVDVHKMTITFTKDRLQGWEIVKAILDRMPGL